MYVKRLHFSGSLAGSSPFPNLRNHFDQNHNSLIGFKFENKQNAENANAERKKDLTKRRKDLANANAEKI